MLFKVGYNDRPGKPKTTQEAFKRRAKEITALGKNVDETIKILLKRTEGLETFAPQTVNLARQKALETVVFLNEKLPKAPYQPTKFTHEWKATDREIYKFTRYLAASENPLLLLDELAENRLSLETVETVKTLYPDLFADIKDQLLEELTKVKGKIPYKYRIMLSNLFEIPLDASMRPDRLAACQRAYMPAEEERPPAYSKKVRFSEREQTRIGEVSNKKRRIG